MHNLPRWGHFQPNFRWSVAAKLLIGIKKFAIEMMARTTSITVQNLVEIEPRTSAWEDEVWCFHFFVCLYTTLGRITVTSDAVALFKRRVSVFVGRFRWGLQLFRGRKALSVDRTDLKIVARWRYDWCANARKNFQNLRKWVQSLCTPLSTSAIYKWDERKVIP